MFKRRTDGMRGHPNGIAQLMDIPLGGVKQWILIRGTNRDNPILLYLHGGPGMSLIGVSSQYFQELERNFIVVNWDQRGSGLSAAEGMPDDSLTVEQYVADAIELSRHLIKRFRKEKIFLVGHSWGSAIGTLAIKRNPELFYGYIGAGQVANMAENEQVEYQRLVDLAEKEDLSFLRTQLERIGPPPYEDVQKSMALRADFTLRYTKNARAEKDFRVEVLKAALTSSEYKAVDLARYLKAHLLSVKLLWHKLLEINLFELASELEVPVFYILGVYDTQVLPEISQRYIEQVQAPQKELVWFETGHSMQYEDPALFQKTVIEKFGSLM